MAKIAILRILAANNEGIMGSQQLIAYKKLLVSIKCGKILSNKINLSGHGLNDDQILALIVALRQLPEVILNQLYELDLSHNNLTQISVRDFPRLSVLNLSSNNLKTIDLKNLPFLRKINLLDNPIARFDPTEYFGIAEFLLPPSFLQPFILEQPKTLSPASLEQYFNKSISSFLRRDSVRDLLITKYYCLAVAGNLPFDLISKIVLDEFKEDLCQNIRSGLQELFSYNAFSYRSAKSEMLDVFLLNRLPDIVENTIKYLAVSFANNKALNRAINKTHLTAAKQQTPAGKTSQQTLAWQYMSGLLGSAVSVKSKILSRLNL